MIESVMAVVVGSVTSATIVFQYLDYKMTQLKTNHKIELSDKTTDSYIEGYKRGKADGIESMKGEMKMFYLSGSMADSKITVYGHKDIVKEVTDSGVKIITS